MGEYEVSPSFRSTEDTTFPQDSEGAPLAAPGNYARRTEESEFKDLERYHVVISSRNVREMSNAAAIRVFVRSDW
jgi:hypothetical protein